MRAISASVISVESATGTYGFISGDDVPTISGIVVPVERYSVVCRSAVHRSSRVCGDFTDRGPLSAEESAHFLAPARTGSTAQKARSTGSFRPFDAHTTLRSSGAGRQVIDEHPWNCRWAYHGENHVGATVDSSAGQLSQEHPQVAGNNAVQSRHRTHVLPRENRKPQREHQDSQEHRERDAADRRATKPGVLPLDVALLSARSWFRPSDETAAGTGVGHVRPLPRESGIRGR